MGTNGNIRYRGFRPTADGGRLFEFSVKVADRESSVVALEIPGPLFGGSNRIMVQEGAGICYKKLRHLYETSGTEPLPLQMTLTDQDITQYRQMPEPTGRTPFGAMHKHTEGPTNVDTPEEQT